MKPLFSTLNVSTGRDSFPPERMLRALLPQVFYSVRAERQPIEQMGYSPPLRWFENLTIADSVWNVTGFTKNRDRLLSVNSIRTSSFLR